MACVLIISTGARIFWLFKWETVQLMIISIEITRTNGENVSLLNEYFNSDVDSIFLCCSLSRISQHISHSIRHSIDENNERLLVSENYWAWKVLRNCDKKLKNWIKELEYEIYRTNNRNGFERYHRKRGENVDLDNFVFLS